MSKPQLSGETELSDLKTLLLGEDRGKISRLEKQLELIKAHAGSEADFSDTLSKVLIETLNRVQNDDPKALARTLSPSIASSIRREVSNSRDAMVEALYPITGRMVAISVRNAIQKLSDEINQKFDYATSPQFLIATLRSKLSGRPVSDYALSEPNSASINQILLIEKSSGISIGQWSGEARVAGDKDMVSGLLSAISSFAIETFKGDTATELQTIDLNGRQLAIRHSAKYILAIDFDGTATGVQKQTIDDCFIGLIDTFEKGCDEPEKEMSNLAIAIEFGKEVRSQSSKGVYILLAGLLLITGYFGLQSFLAWDFESRVTAVREVVKKQPEIALYPLQIQGDLQANTIEVSGIVPNGFDQQNLLASLADMPLNGASVELHFSYVVSEKDLADFQTATTDAKVRHDTLSSTLHENAEKDRTSMAAVEQKLSGLRSSINMLQADLWSASDSQKKLSNTLDKISDTVSNFSKSPPKIDRALVKMTSEITTTNEQVSEFTRDLTDALNTIDRFSNTLSQIASLVAQNQQLLKRYQEADVTRLKTFKITFEKASAPKDEYGTEIVLSQIAGILSRNSFDIVIYGHSDKTGSEDVNVEISLDRARFIQDKLIKLGVTAERLKVVGLGSKKRLSIDNEDDKQNRRVEFAILE